MKETGYFRDISLKILRNIHYSLSSWFMDTFIPSLLANS